MSRSKFVPFLLLTLAITVTLPALATAQSRKRPHRDTESLPAPPVYSRQKSFSIPFQVNEPVGSDTAPVEVRLFLSTDLGRTWKLADRAQPQSRAFSFQATRDGMYWFSLRTVDATGRLHPAGPHSTGLRVHVDTQPPQVTVSASRGSAGEVIIRWAASDDSLASNRFKLSYQTSAGSPWRPITIPPTSQRQQSGRSDRGSTIWWPNRATGQITIRAEAADAAGNINFAQADLYLPSQDLDVKGKTNLTARGPSVASPENGSEDVASNPESNHARSSSATGAYRRRVTSPTSGQSQSVEGWPFDKISDVSLRRSLEGTRTSSRHDRTATRPLRSVAQPSVGQRVEQESSRLYKDLRALGERPYMVRSTSFKLRYDVESVGPSGIGKVQLWKTRDGGKHWEESLVDHDRKSPLVASVSGPGLYGFRITVQNQMGEGSRAPRAGDLPEIWIGVDLSRPKVAIDEVRPTGDARQKALDIRWQATDEHLATRPVTLLYATSAEGPWTTIAAGLENTGRYRWRLGSRQHRQVYLRIEARDAAGNMGIFQTVDPVRLSGESPQARIQGVESIEAAAAAPLERRRP